VNPFCHVREKHMAKVKIHTDKTLLCATHDKGHTTGLAWQRALCCVSFARHTTKPFVVCILDIREKKERNLACPESVTVTPHCSHPRRPHPAGYRSMVSRSGRHPAAHTLLSTTSTTTMYLRPPPHTSSSSEERSPRCRSHNHRPR
jgi:hypothetical protein